MPGEALKARNQSLLLAAARLAAGKGCVTGRRALQAIG